MAGSAQAATPTPSPSPTSDPTIPLPDVEVTTLVDRLIGTPLIIAAIVLVALIARLIWHRVVDAVVRRMETIARTHERASETGAMAAAFGELIPSERRRQRTEAVGALLRSVGTVTITVIAFLLILARVGVDVAPLLAGAGIIGIALGFGAQSLVTDFLSGIFMVLEDQYGVGDFVDTGTVVGEVEDVGLRITRLRDLNGVVWYIRNGEIRNLGNRSQGWSFVAVDMPVGYDEDLTRVREVVDEVGTQMLASGEWGPRLLDAPALAGVESVSGNAVIVRITTRAAAQQQLPVGRELRQRLKQAFDAAGIAIPTLPLPPQGP